MVESFSGATSVTSSAGSKEQDSQESELAMVSRGSNTHRRYYERPYVEFVGERRRPGHRRIRSDAGGDPGGSGWHTEIDRLKHEQRLLERGQYAAIEIGAQ